MASIDKKQSIAFLQKFFLSALVIIDKIQSILFIKVKAKRPKIKIFLDANLPYLYINLIFSFLSNINKTHQFHPQYSAWL